MKRSRTVTSLKSSISLTPQYTIDQDFRFQNNFTPTRPSKIKLNPQKEVKSAMLYINKDKLVIKNLHQLEPLSHLVDDEKLIEVLCKILVIENDL